MNAPFLRHGLTENPYRLQPLDCLKREKDHDALLPIAAFAALRAIDDDLKQAFEAGEPRFYLVTGVNGSGRTSVANCLIDRYRNAAGLPKNGIVVPNLGTGEEHEASALGPMRKWLNQLEIELRIKRRVTLDDSLRNEFDQERKATAVEDAAAMAARASVVVASLHYFLNSLGPKRFGFATLIENVPSVAFARAVMSFFENVPTVCVFTTSNRTEGGREVERELKGAQHLHSISLPELTGADAVRVIRDRWSRASDLAYPFLDDVIEQWCARCTGRSIGRILHVIAELLEYEVLDDPPLQFTHAVLEAKLQRIDRLITFSGNR